MKKIHNRIQMNIFISVLLLFFGAALIVLFAYLFVCGSMDQISKFSETINLSILFNYLPVLLIAFTFSLLFANVFYGLGVTALIVDIFAFADYYMIEYRGEPLSYGDLFSLKEGLSAVNHFSIEIDVFQLVLIIAAALILFGLGFMTKNRALKIPVRLILSALCIIVFLFCCNYLYSKDFPQYSELKSNESLGKQYNCNIKCQMVGPVFFFIDSYKDYSVSKPDGYNKHEYKEAVKNSTINEISNDTIMPDVIFVTCECFSDLSDIDFLNYSSNSNPISEFHKLCSSKNSINGYIYTPVYGGGTCNTELEILRSMFSMYISYNMSNVVRGEKDSIVTRFEEYGYHSIYIHPGDDWFYNRKNVMKNIGFDETYFLDDFKDPEYLHQMVSDKSVADFIIEKYEAQNNSENPCFINAMTIAGHFPFFWEEGMKFAPIKGELSSESYAEFSMYMVRMSETNQMIEALSYYFSDVDRPVILVFYGDHLPALGNNGSIYAEIGYPIYDESGAETPEKYKIPYLIWGNSAASGYFRNVSDVQKNISAPYLGVSVLDLLGLAEGNAYYDFLLDLKNNLPVIHRNFCIDKEGNELYKIPDEFVEQIETLREWNYYYLKDN